MDQRLKEIETAYREKILSDKVYRLEKELLPVIEAMEKNGIKVDITFLKKTSQEVNNLLRKTEKKIYRLARIQFNINSAPQLSEILFDKLKISTEGLRKTPGGVISTAAAELQKIRGKHQIIDFILEYRELNKLKTTYLDTLPQLINGQDRVHTTYHPLGTSTGRLSSSDPNLQNIPIRGRWGQAMREIFIPEKGRKLLSADYSQIELRVAACLAHDQKMLKAFEDDKDIHKITAAEVNNVTLSEVTPGMRFQAKALNFGILYGISINGFAQAAHLPWDESKKFIEKYMADFKGIANYVEAVKEETREKGYIETALGRRRYLPQIKSTNFRERQAAERMAINMPVQGTAADIMKVAMIKLYQELKKTKSQARILLQVHDELVLEVVEKEVETVVVLVKEAMEKVMNEPIFSEVRKSFTIPLKVDIKVGNNWGQC